jgi:hypothetical protein
VERLPFLQLSNWKPTITPRQDVAERAQKTGGDAKNVAARNLPRTQRKNEVAYFRLVLKSIEADSLAMKAAPHQLVPSPLGFCAVMKLGEKLTLCALVKALHSDFDRFES